MITGDFFGFVILLLSYFLFFLDKDIFSNKRLLLTIFFVISLHHIIALYNVYFHVTFGADTDAITFHKTATEISKNIFHWQFIIGAPFYSYFIAWFYKIFGVSVFLGEELSVLAFAISCLFLIKMAKLLQIKNYLSLLMLLYGSLPSMIFMGSLILRESWEILFFMMSLYFCLINLKNYTLLSWLGYLFSSCVLALFHEGLVLYIFFLAALMILWHIGNPLSLLSHTKRQYFLILTACTSLLLFLCVAIYMAQAPELEAFHAFSNGESMNFVSSFRHHASEFDARTSYGMIMNTSTTSNFLISLVSNFVNYMFAPFPWNVHNILDFYAMCESLLRFILILTSIYGLLIFRGEQHYQLTFLFAAFFLMSGLWSLATLNYGTGIRHHLISYWILLITFGMTLNNLLHRQLVHRDLEFQNI